MGALVSVFGGTGFIGRRLVERLVGRGLSVRIVARRGDAGARPAAGVEHLSGDIEEAFTVARAVERAWAVVNLVGTTAARHEAAFMALHRDAPAKLAAAARQAGVQRFIQVSAMGIALDAPSMADRSKAAGEQAVQDAFAQANIVRPALIYGPGDHFFARFVPLVRSAPAIPLIGGGRTRFQPMHLDDFTEALARVLEAPEHAGRTFELGASEIVSFRELIERLCRVLQRRPRLVQVPFPLAEALAFATQWMPSAPLSVDQVRLLKTDKIIRDAQSGPAALGIDPRPLEPFLATLA